MSPSRPAADRRQHRRITARIPVRFGVEGRMCDGAIVDLSEGGVQVRSSEPFSAGVVLDLFVNFPRRRLRLRARVLWVRGAPPTMGLSFVKPEKSLMIAYDEWVTETRGGAGDRDAPEIADRPSGDPAGQESAAARPATAAPPVAEPAGPISRHVETARGSEFDVRIEKEGSAWRLVVHASPRPSPGGTAEIDRTFPDYASLDAAFRLFLKNR